MTSSQHSVVDPATAVRSDNLGESPPNELGQDTDLFLDESTGTWYVREFGSYVAITGTGGGGPGSGDLTYVFTQFGLASTWNINHNLGKHPAVEVVDTGDNVIIPDVHYVDVNNLTLTFGAATSGKAYLN